MNIYNGVVTRLKGLGYKFKNTATEKAAILYAVDRAELTLKSNINRPGVPGELSFVWTDMATGLYLYDLKAAGQLNGGAFDFSAPTKTISEGDTSVTFASEGVKTPEARFDALLNSMIHPPQEQLAACRRMKW